MSTSSSSTTTISKKQTLDEETRRKNEMLLKEIEKASAQSSKFIKFEESDHKILRMLPQQTEPITVRYPSNPDEEVRRYRFMVFEQTIDEESGALKDATQEPQEWTTSVTVTKDLITWINKGYFVLDITREGKGLNTRYRIAPYVD